MNAVLFDLPLWLIFVLLSAASYRITRFFVFDSLMGFNLVSESKMSARLDAFAYTPEGDDRSWIRGKIGDLLTCVFCLGAHVTWIVVCLWFSVWPWDLSVREWIFVFAVMGGQAFLSSRANS